MVFKVKSHIDRHDERHEPERRADRARASIKLWVVEDRPVLGMATGWKIELNEKMGDDPVEKKGPRCALADDAGGDHRVEEEITEEIILPKTNYLAIVLCQIGERRKVGDLEAEPIENVVERREVDEENQRYFSGEEKSQKAGPRSKELTVDGKIEIQA